MGPVAIPADKRGRRTSRRGGGPPKLGNMEKPPRPPAHLQHDPGAHRTWRVRRVPDKNRTGDDGDVTTAGKTRTRCSARWSVVRRGSYPATLCVSS